MYKETLIYNLKEKREELLKDIEAIDERLLKYRKGSLFKQNDYYYIKYYENGKTISTYVGKSLSTDQIEDINRELKNHKTLERRKKDLLNELKEVNKLIKKYGGEI